MEELIIAGLHPLTFCEVFQRFSISDGCVTSFEVSAATERSEMECALNYANGVDGRFYGLRELNALINFFVHPHSIVPLSDGYIVSYRQAHFFRRFFSDGSHRTYKPGSNTRIHSLISATNYVTDHHFTYAALNWSQLQRSSGDWVSARLVTVDLDSGFTVKDRSLAPFAREGVHQVLGLATGWTIAVDMCMAVACSTESSYFDRSFPTGNIIFSHEEFGDIVWDPGVPAAGHVEVHPQQKDVIFLSCHNISKRGREIGIHGPGALIRIRISVDGPELDTVERFSDAGFLRITSHKAFMHRGRPLLAVTGYPNKVYIIDCDTMRVVRMILLFPDTGDYCSAFCPKDDGAPLFLECDSDGNQLYLANGHQVFVVGVNDGSVSVVPFTEKGSFLPTAHLLRRTW